MVVLLLSFLKNFHTGFDCDYTSLHSHSYSFGQVFDMYPPLLFTRSIHFLTHCHYLIRIDLEAKD